MAIIGRYELAADLSADPTAAEKLVRATVSEGEGLIRFSGCDYNMVAELLRGLRKQGLPVAGFQYEDYPPEYFIDGGKASPIAPAN